VNPDKNFDFVMRAAAIPASESGVMLSFTPTEAGWETLGFTARRLAPGDVWLGTTGGHEAIIVVLGGKLTIDWGEGQHSIGQRENVFSGYPYSAYLPCDLSFKVRAETLVEFAEVRVQSQKKLKPRIIPPAEVGTEVRGSGNATRQILRILRPEAEADRLMANEVYTPDGNWSSYPPHKHDTLNLPAECDLDELYYFRVDRPEGFAFLRVYDSAGKQDSTALIRDGDLGLLRSGYHLVAAPPGYRVYYLAVLAGAARSLAASTDPSYDHLKGSSSKPDPRVPFIHRESKP
jgi:5-deoxy-glucuronate isomerase